MFGKNTITEPTPPIMPCDTRDISHSGAFAATRSDGTTSASQPTKESIMPTKGSASVNVR